MFMAILKLRKYRTKFDVKFPMWISDILPEFEFRDHGFLSFDSATNFENLEFFKLVTIVDDIKTTKPHTIIERWAVRDTTCDKIHVFKSVVRSNIVSIPHRTVMVRALEYIHEMIRECPLSGKLQSTLTGYLETIGDAPFVINDHNGTITIREVMHDMMSTYGQLAFIHAYENDPENEIAILRRTISKSGGWFPLIEFYLQDFCLPILDRNSEVYRYNGEPIEASYFEPHEVSMLETYYNTTDGNSELITENLKEFPDVVLDSGGNLPYDIYESVGKVPCTDFAIKYILHIRTPFQDSINLDYRIADGSLEITTEDRYQGILDSVDTMPSLNKVCQSISDYIYMTLSNKDPIPTDLSVHVLKTYSEDVFIRVSRSDGTVLFQTHWDLKLYSLISPAITVRIR